MHPICRLCPPVNLSHKGRGRERGARERERGRGRERGARERERGERGREFHRCKAFLENIF